jgi:hypothetical protein
LFIGVLFFVRRDAAKMDAEIAAEVGDSSSQPVSVDARVED